MNLLIDASILLDVFQKRDPFYHASALIWKLCETGMAKGFVSALSVADLAYIMRKELDREAILETIRRLNLIFHFVELTPVDLIRAAELRWADYEDAIQSVTAERLHADYIISRNIKHFRGSRVLALTPGEYLAREG